MITSITFTNLKSPTPDVITFNTDTSPYPVTSYEDTIQVRHESRPKSGAHGSWPVFNYEETMEIRMEGAILANDSDDYTTKRWTLTSCLRYKPGTPQRRAGRFDVLFDNVSEHVYADVIVDSMDIPRNGASPNYSTFQIVLISFVPYYIGVTSGNPFYDA